MFSRRVYLLPVLLAVLCATTLSPMLFTARAFAATDPINVTGETSTVTFPKEIDFQVSVQDSSSAIVAATLTISSSKPRYFQVDRTVPVTTPSQTLTLQWREDTTGDNFAYPGTPISYTWQFHDRADHWHTQAAQNVTIIDTRFNWQHISQGLVQVYWYNQSVDFANVILSQAVENLKRISANLGGSLLHPINLWVYANSEDFHGSLPPQVHEWVGGIAFPPLDEASIVVDSTNADTLYRDMPHELTHLLFHQLIAQGILAPLWFDEGLAVYNQIYHEPEMTNRFKRALASETLLPLTSISYTFPADADQAYLAYAQSWNIIGYMYSTFGQMKIGRLIALMNNNTYEFNDDVKQALGEDELHLENQWRLQLHQPPIVGTTSQLPTPKPSYNPTKVQLLTDSNTPLLILAGVLLIVLPLLGISTLLVYQRRSRRRSRDAQQAQQIVNTTFAPSGSSYIQRPYSSYARSSPEPNIAYESLGAIPYIDAAKPYTDAVHSPSQNNAALPQPFSKPQPTSPGQHAFTSPPTWEPMYPFSVEYNNHDGKDSATPPFKPGQEYLNQPPSQQAPQE